jgi:hypothetical protein
MLEADTDALTAKEALARTDGHTRKAMTLLSVQKHGD